MSCTPGKVEVVGVQEVQGTEAFVLRFLQCASVSRRRRRVVSMKRERPTTAATRETAATRRCRDDEWIGKVFFAKFDPKVRDSASFLNLNLRRRRRHDLTAP